MQSPVLLAGALSDLFAQVSSSGCVTTADHYGPMAALLDEQLDSEERCVIDRLLRAVCWGRVVSADEISAVGERGYDAGQKIKGRKRHILVDTMGMLLTEVVTTANMQARQAAKAVFQGSSRRCTQAGTAKGLNLAIRDN